MHRILQRILLAVIISGLAVYIVTELFPARFSVTSDPEWLGFVLVGFIFGFLNAFIKPLIKMLSLPLVIMTLGIFLVFINAFVLWLVVVLSGSVFASLGLGIAVNGGVFSYLLVGVSLGIVNTLLHWILRK
jgi:putative membrane protein